MFCDFGVIGRNNSPGTHTMSAHWVARGRSTKRGQLNESASSGVQNASVHIVTFSNVSYLEPQKLPS